LADRTERVVTGAAQVADGKEDGFVREALGSVRFSDVQWLFVAETLVRVRNMIGNRPGMSAREMLGRVVENA
jgi:hypothetical protein